jgi:hypothetical protein
MEELLSFLASEMGDRHFVILVFLANLLDRCQVESKFLKDIVELNVKAMTVRVELDHSVEIVS